MVIARPLGIRCPGCKTEIRIMEVLVCSDYTVVVNGKCLQCKEHITSGSISLLELVPTDDKKGN